MRELALVSGGRSERGTAGGSMLRGVKINVQAKAPWDPIHETFEAALGMLGVPGINVLFVHWGTVASSGWNFMGVARAIRTASRD